MQKELTPKPWPRADGAGASKRHQGTSQEISMGWRPHHRPGVGVTGPVQRSAEQQPHQLQDTEGEVSLLPCLARFACRGNVSEHQAVNHPLQTLRGGAGSSVVGIPARTLRCQPSGTKLAPLPMILTLELRQLFSCMTLCRTGGWLTRRCSAPRDDANT